MSVTNFDHVHIYSSDPRASLDFYCDVLGAEPIGQLSATAGRFNELVLLGGQFLAIGEFPEGMAPKSPPPAADGALQHGFGVAHLGLNVDDLDEVVGRLEREGVEVHSSPRSGGPLRYVYFTAPDGVVIELTEYVLPKRLAPAAAALKAINKTIHATRKVLGRGLVRAATRSS